jgi:hypothetical protein
MATTKMRIKHLYRAGEHEFLEQNYGIKFNKEKEHLSSQIHRVIQEDSEVQKALAEEETKKNDQELVEKMEYLETLDINQLRAILKTTFDIPHKQVMKMKKEEIIAELLK